jgi:hypothetical protein
MFESELPDIAGDEPVELTDQTLVADPGALAREQRALQPVRDALIDAGFYAYPGFDDEGRWSIAVDDEAGRVDVRIGEDGYVVEISGSSPGLFADEESDWRRRAHERLARMVIPNISRGLLLDHQSVRWDEVEQGVSVRLRYELPFTASDQIGRFVRERFPEVDEVIAQVESKIAG